MKAVISSVLGVPVEEIGDESGPDTIEGWDSVSHLSLVMALEEEFDVRFGDEEAFELLSVSEILAALESQHG